MENPIKQIRRARKQQRIIGIVGGMGPYAGLDLNRKIFDHTQAVRDQDYPEVYLLSRSADLVDRTKFLQKSSSENPALGIFRTLQKLSAIGAQVIGIPCNTSHTPVIYKKIQSYIAEAHLPIHLVHLIKETKYFLQIHYPQLKKFGLLCTQGTYDTHIYSEILEQNGLFQVITPSQQDQQKVHQAICNPDFGIKSSLCPSKKQASYLLQTVAKKLLTQGAEAIIMGCTEIPLVLHAGLFSHPVLLIDPTDILAQALIREAQMPLHSLLDNQRNQEQEHISVK